MLLLGWVVAAVAIAAAIFMRAANKSLGRESVALSEYVSIVLLNDEIRGSHSSAFKSFVSENMPDTTLPNVWKLNQAARNMALNCVAASGGCGIASAAFLQEHLDDGEAR